MAKWIGPGRFTTSVGSSQAAALQAQARKIVGELQNQVKLGKIWQGFRRIQLADGVEIVAHVDSTYPDNPLVRATIVTPEKSTQSREREVILFGGFVLRDGNDEETVLSPTTRTPGYTIRQRLPDVSELIPASTPKYYNSVFPSGIEFGNADWQGALGPKFILSWNTPRGHRVDTINVAAGPQIYYAGKEHARSPEGNVLGVAINKETAELVLISYKSDASSDRLMAFSRPWQNTPYAYNGMKNSSNPNGWEEIDRQTLPVWTNKKSQKQRLQPTSVAAFNASGTKAAFLMTTWQDPNAFAEVYFSKAEGFSIIYGQAGRYVDSGETSNTFSGIPSEIISPGQSKTLRNVRMRETTYTWTINYGIAKDSYSGFPLAQNVPVALDYVGDTLLRLHFRVPTLTASSTGFATQEHRYAVFMDWDEETNLGWDFTLVESSYSATLSGSGIIDISAPLYINDVMIAPNQHKSFPGSGSITAHQTEPEYGYFDYFDVLSGTLNSGLSQYDDVVVAYVDLRAGVLILDYEIESRSYEIEYFSHPTVNPHVFIIRFNLNGSFSENHTLGFSGFPNRGSILKESHSYSGFIEMGEPEREDFNAGSTVKISPIEYIAIAPTSDLPVGFVTAGVPGPLVRPHLFSSHRHPVQNIATKVYRAGPGDTRRFLWMTFYNPEENPEYIFLSTSSYASEFLAPAELFDAVFTADVGVL